MATSSQAGHSALSKRQLDLVSGAWVELGVSGWQRTHQDWTVDPEPLIIQTAALGDTDPRLRDEALDWCIGNWRYVSRVRLRNLLAEQPPGVLEAWGPFAATVSKHAGIRWPSATKEFRYTTTGRSSLESMARPSRAWLRMRAMFGLGARTEILRYFISGHHRATAATIARRVRYAKRNVADECESLVKAGVLRTQQVANRFYYMPDRADELIEFVGEVAPIQPDWTALFAVTNALVALEQAAQTLPSQALLVEAHRVASGLDDQLNALDIDERPRLVHPDHYWPAVRDFAERYLSAWASGEWEPEEEPVVRRPKRVLRRPDTAIRA